MGTGEYVVAIGTAYWVGILSFYGLLEIVRWVL
jgi:hypothetical protein